MLLRRLVRNDHKEQIISSMQHCEQFLVGRPGATRHQHMPSGKHLRSELVERSRSICSGNNSIITCIATDLNRNVRSKSLERFAIFFGNAMDQRQLTIELLEEAAHQRRESR